MTYNQLYSTVTERLMATGIEDAKTDAWRLFEEIGGMSRSSFFLKGRDEAPLDFTEKIERAAEKRAQHIPLQYITGYQDFYGCSIRVSEDTLIPRFDTEVLVDTAVSHMESDGREVSVLDVCTGTGCILIAVAHEIKERHSRDGLYVGCDLSRGAVELAMENASKNNVKAEFFQGDLYEALSETQYENKGFDYILSNPPYIKSNVIPTLSEEVRDHEPMTALDGGEDGLIFYRRIIKDAHKHLAKGGRIIFEIGYDQGKEVSELLSEAGFTDVRVIKDLAGLDRIVEGQLI